VLALPKSVTRLYICEDGELSRLPWSKFEVEATDRPTLLICQLDSPRELASVRKPRNSPRDFSHHDCLLIGGITYHNSALELPGAALEVKQIADLAQSLNFPAITMTGSTPTKAAVLAKLIGCDLVHVASHGFFDSAIGSPATEKSVTANSVDSATNSRAETIARNPLIKSGIILAPSADDKDHEGKLTAEELVGTDLQDCDLFVLSACDTGRGEEVTGQGVIGLRSAIMAAGAKNVLLSLWPVDDQATRALMNHFYTNLWKDHLCPAQALKNAQIAVRDDPEHKEWSKPEYWAGWQLVGMGWPKQDRSEYEDLFNSIEREDKTSRMPATRTIQLEAAQNTSLAQ
jgi:hypothetical protein